MPYTTDTIPGAYTSCTALTMRYRLASGLDNIADFILQEADFVTANQ